MGSAFSSILTPLFGKRDERILLLGLYEAGKTTILQKLKMGEVKTITPTSGFNIEMVEHKNLSFASCDVCGQEGTPRIRPLWKYFFANTRAVIFVVDSVDKDDRVSEAEEKLQNLLKDDDLKNVLLLLVFANKQDLPNAMSTAELTEKLGLNRYLNLKWHIQPTCATKGQGLYEGLDWLSNELAKAK